MLSRCCALLDLALDSSSRSPRPGKGASMRGSPREESRERGVWAEECERGVSGRLEREEREDAVRRENE